ncbi:MAG: ABC transporter permease [Clostridium sp.]|nr:ABC transporter permease [Clostridium sp.]MBO6149617.1 ABC transporter permease [Clostridium sp.]
MIRHILQRLLESAVVLFGVALMIFLMLQVVPGNPVATLMGEHADRAAIARMTAELGLDQPLYVRFGRYIAGALKGDFGTSYSLGRPVSSLMAQAFGNTLKLAAAAAVFAWILGIICGIIAAVKKNGLLDHLFMGLSLLGVSMPVFVVAMILQYIFAYHLHWLPISGVSDWRGFILPAVALGWNSAGSVSRLVRSDLLEILEQDYIDTARAKGLTQTGVLVFHALRNALLPVVTMMALQFSSLLSGAVITETVFSINGIGRLAVQAISGRDIPLLEGTALFATLVVLAGNLLADLLYAVLDPRIGREVQDG